MKDLINYSQELQKPFEPEDVEWRVQQAGVSRNGKPYAMVIPYITNRAVQKRLDDVFGPLGWEDEYKELADGSGFLCGITIHGPDRSVTKWDGAEKTNIESVKGGLSDAEKRAAVKLGIGRYLYHMDVVFAECQIVDSRYQAENYHYDKKTNSHVSWKTPELPAWAMPTTDYSQFTDAILSASTMAELEDAFKMAVKVGKANQDKELIERVIKLKDHQKAEIETGIEAANQVRLERLEYWLEKECVNFKELPSESTVNNYKLVIGRELDKKVNGLTINPEPLLTLLNLRHQERINELNQR